MNMLLIFIPKGIEQIFKIKFDKMKKASDFSEAFCGPDGTRTRDLRRDRAAF